MEALDPTGGLVSRGADALFQQGTLGVLLVAALAVIVVQWRAAIKAGDKFDAKYDAAIERYTLKIDAMQNEHTERVEELHKAVMTQMQSGFDAINSNKEAFRGLSEAVSRQTEALNRLAK